MAPTLACMEIQSSAPVSTRNHLRVLMLSDVYFPRVNGVSTSIQTFRKCLVEAGHDVTLVAPVYGDELAEPNLVRIAARSVPRDPEDRMMQWGSLMRRGSELAAQGYDVVHVQTPFLAHYAGVKIARRYGLPIVESYHTFFEEYLYHYVPFVPATAMRFVARRFSSSQCNAVDGLVVPSQAMLDVLRGYGVQAPATVIPTGIDLRQFSTGDGAHFRAAHGIARDRPMMLYVGRVVFEKNIEFLLRMARAVVATVPDAILVIAGEGPAVQPLRELAATLGLANNTLFVGYLDRSGPLMDCYRAADAFVFASRTETQGLVLLEAMALGVPVVSTAIMGAKDIVGPGRGAIVAHEDVEDFSMKVVRVLTSPTLKKSLAADGREFARRWAEDGFAERLVEFYRNTIVAHQARPATVAAV